MSGFSLCVERQPDPLDLRPVIRIRLMLLCDIVTELQAVEEHIEIYQSLLKTVPGREDYYRSRIEGAHADRQKIRTLLRRNWTGLVADVKLQIESFLLRVATLVDP
jgi:hypothetical protein